MSKSKFKSFLEKISARDFAMASSRGSFFSVIEAFDALNALVCDVFIERIERVLWGNFASLIDQNMKMHFPLQQSVVFVPTQNASRRQRGGKGGGFVIAAAAPDLYRFSRCSSARPFRARRSSSSSLQNFIGLAATASNDIIRDDEEEEDDEALIDLLLSKKKKKGTTRTTTIEERRGGNGGGGDTTSSNEFEKCVDENLTKLTTLFFDRLLTRIEEKMANGDKKEAEELDELAQSALVVVESRATFERASEVGFPETLRDSISAHEATLKKQLADGSGGERSKDDNTLETYSIETQVKQRWAALTKAMEETGTENALSQKMMNREQAKSSATELIGRAKLNTEEAKTLFTTAVPPERRIIEFLLEYEPGPERSQLLTDALTPPDEEDLKEMEENEEVEVVSTTPAKLSCALEVYLKEVIDNSSKSSSSNNSSGSDSAGGDDDDKVMRVRALAEEVKERL